MTTKVLMFKGTSAFEGLNIMTDCLGRGFETLGWEPLVIDLREENAYLNTLNALIEDDIRLIVGINAMGRAVITQENGETVLDETGGFYQYVGIPILDLLVDHPVYLYNRLQVPLKTHKIMVPNTSNVGLVRRWIRDDVPVRHGPHGANIPAPGDVRPWADRDIDLFASMSLNHHPDGLRAAWAERFDPATAARLNAVVEEQEAAPAAALEDTVARVFGPAARTIATMMPYFVEVDYYLRAAIKLRTATAIAKAGLPLTIMGPGWPDLGGRVTILPAANGTEPLRFMGRARMVLNLQPLYFDSHERPLQAGLHGAIAASTSSAWLDGAMDRANLSLGADADAAAAAIGDALADPGLADRAARGREAVARAHTWGHRAAEILAFAFADPP